MFEYPLAMHALHVGLMDDINWGVLFLSRIIVHQSCLTSLGSCIRVKRAPENRNVMQYEPQCLLFKFEISILFNDKTPYYLPIAFIVVLSVIVPDRKRRLQCGINIFQSFIWVVIFGCLVRWRSLTVLVTRNCCSCPAMVDEWELNHLQMAALLTSVRALQKSLSVNLQIPVTFFCT